MKYLKTFNESNEEKKYLEIDYNEFKIKKEERIVIPNESIIEISKCKGKKWMRGWIGGKQTFDFSSYEEMSEKFLMSKEESKLILLQISMSNVRVVDMDIYYLNTSEYLVRCKIFPGDPDEYFILKNITDLNSLVEECFVIVSKEYPRILD
jgi:hypothetical protein